MPAPLIAAGIAVASRLAAKKVAQEAAKKVTKKAAKKIIPTAIKTPTKNYTLKRTVSGKIKVTDTAKKTSVKLPKNSNVTVQKIKKANADKYIKKANTKEKALGIGIGSGIGASIGVPAAVIVVKKRSNKKK
jgi:hypothetical protein